MMSFLSLLFQPQVAETPVRATLADGQVLMGEVQTRTLRLATGAGILEVPLADVGEVVPVGDGLGVAEGNVNVWLRNGSELRGRWSDPELAMGIAVGGGTVPIHLPMNELSRFQLSGGERWPEGPIYRMRTSWGDDFLVDPSRTTLVIENQLGTFSPLLTECRSLAPIGDPTGDWRVELLTGTVLIGALRDAALTVALPMGPKEMTVPLANFVSLKLERWGPPVPTPDDHRERAESEAVSGRSYGPAAPVTAGPIVEATPGVARRPTSASSDAGAAEDMWFEADSLNASKDAAE